MTFDLDNRNMKDMTEKIIANIKNIAVREEVKRSLSAIALSMDSKDLRRIIEELIKFEDGKEFLKENWRIIINNSHKPEEIVSALGADDKIREDMLSNIDYFFKYAEINDYSVLAKEISKLDGGPKTISENFDLFIDNSNSNLDDIIIPALETEQGRKKVKEEFERLKIKMLRNPYTPTLQSFLKVIRSLENVEGFESIYEDYGYWGQLYSDIDVLEHREDIDSGDQESPVINDIELIEFLLGKKIKPGTVLRMRDILAIDAKNQEFTNVFLSEDRAEKRMILETVANKNKYSFKSAGTSSLTLVAGNQVVKIGSRKRKFEIPYHPRIMMPYFRKKYDDDTTLEVYNLGNTKSAKITDESLLQIYKELESVGIIWTDARKENVVELLSDNVLPDFIASKDFNLFGFMKDERYPTTNHIALKKGDLVICDLDMLYLKDDPDMQIGMQDDIIRRYIDSKEKSVEDDKKDISIEI